MYKTQEDFDIVDAYRAVTNKETWVGIINRDMDNKCNACDNYLYWIDGDGPINFASAPWIDSTNFNGNEHLPCFRMVANGGGGDDTCEAVKPFICQLDCANPNTDFDPPACKPSLSGYWKMYDGQYYRVTDSRKDFWEGMKECRQDGARLAVTNTFAASTSIQFMVTSNVDYMHGIRAGFMNPEGLSCQDNPVSAASTNCANKIHQIDGSVIHLGPWLYQTSIQANLGYTCMITKYITDTFHYMSSICSNEYRSLCQFSCSTG